MWGAPNGTTPEPLLEPAADPVPVAASPDEVLPVVTIEPVPPWTVAEPDPGVVPPVDVDPVGCVVVGVEGDVVVVVVGVDEMKLLVKVAEQVALLPPPVAEPLHWLTVTGSAVDAPATVHSTPVEPPPPVTEPLHWVTVALVVLATGVQFTSVPPPLPDPMH